MLTTVQCIVCEGDVPLPGTLMEGELLTCSDCGTELEVITLNPVTVAEAPEVQEDWGE
ncbi:MAG: lysine biosynthesis protein LysW [Synergistaceae bacterium]|nr:lysine biosynthesis protein LysW [Synergistaceae bacterium]